MQSNNYQNWIASTVETMLPKHSSPDIMLLFQLESSMFLHIDKKSYQKRNYFLLGFQRPSNYTKVFLHKLDKIVTNVCNDGPFKMKMVSDHSSGWVTDGLEFIFENWMYLRKKVSTKAGIIDNAYMMANENWCFRPIYLSNNIDYYKFDIEASAETYHYYINFQKKVPITEIHKYLPK